MDAVLRAVAIYLVLLLLFRLTGKRTLAQVTTFDLVIVLIVGESTQQALLGEDFSVVHATLVIATLLLLQRFSDHLAWRSDRFDKLSEGVPTVLVSKGELVESALDHSRLKAGDIMEAAREKQGLDAWTRSSGRSSRSQEPSPSSRRTRPRPRPDCGPVRAPRPPRPRSTPPPGTPPARAAPGAPR